MLAALLPIASVNAAEITVNSTGDPAGFNPAITIAKLGATVTLRDSVNANNTPGDDEISFASEVEGYARGGGYNAGTLTVSDSTFSSNSALISGGGIHNAAGSPFAVTDTVSNDCVAYTSGGPIATADNSSLSVVSNSTFIDNRVLGFYGVDTNDAFGAA